MHVVNRTLTFKGKSYCIYGIEGIAVLVTNDNAVIGQFPTEKSAIKTVYSRFNKLLDRKEVGENVE